MNIADIIILIIAVAVVYLGFRRGTIRLLCGVAGILVGVFIAGLLYEKLAFLTQSSGVKTIVLAAILVGAVFLTSDIMLVAGRWLQHKAPRITGTLPDKIAGGSVAFIGTITIIWVIAVIFGSLLPQIARSQLEGSFVLTRIAEYATTPPVISNMAKLLRPFDSPDVFVGQEPDFGEGEAINKTYEDIDAATKEAMQSTVKVTTWGCGSISNGSGVVVGQHYVATNAHVVAGSDRITIQNQGMSFVGNLVWFDPKLDFALLQTEADLPGKVVAINTRALEPGAVTAALGYAESTGLQAGDAVILQRLRADGYDIYRQSKVVRSVYALRGNVVAGNSGGPVINSKGELVGLIFGHSTHQTKTGYAITADQISDRIQTAHDLQTIVSPGSCAAS